MTGRHMAERIRTIKGSVQYDILTPELKVLVELYAEKEKGLHVNETTRRLRGHLSKTSIEKALMRLDDQGLVRTHLGIVRSGHAERLAKICEISGETTAKYIENLIDAIYLSLRTTRKG